MPLVRGCRNRHCPQYADETGWCPAHRREPFFHVEPLPPGWPAIRAAQLAAFPFCRDCGAVATEVHHVYGRDRPELASLCGPCHAAITNREGGSSFP